MKNDNRNTGNKGENLAEKYLENKGYKIVERNYRTQVGELDIVCWDNNILVFVEVKTKIGHDFGEPEEMIDNRKLSQVKRLGEIYCLQKKWDGGCRVDVVAVVLGEDEKVERIKHYEGVY